MRRHINQTAFLLLSVFMLSEIVFRLLLAQGPGGGGQSCGECQSPLVELKNVKFEGDLPQSGKFDWGSEGRGKAGTSSAFLRGMEIFAGGFKKANPCADIKYTLEDNIARQNPISTRPGTSKYDIETTINIKQDAGQVLVFHNAGATPQLALVPSLGTAFIRNVLIAKKNGMTYDQGEETIDWLPDAPEGDNYFAAPGEKLVQGGKTYSGSSGIIVGKEFSPGSLSSIPIYFEKGDIGITIRKMETPSDCSIEIDDSPHVPPYPKLVISHIMNQFNTLLPDNVRLAIRVQKGEITGGEKLEGWQVFKTAAGTVTDAVFYKPPQCPQTAGDTLDVAGVCEFSDGPPSVMKPKFTKEIPNWQCHDAFLQISRIDTEKRSREVRNPNGTSIQKEVWDDYTAATAYVVLTQDITTPIPMLNEIIEHYKISSASLNNFQRIAHHDYYDRETSGSTHSRAGGEIRRNINSIGHDAQWANYGASLPEKPFAVMVFVDAKTKKAKKVIFGGFNIEYEIRINETVVTRSWGPGGVETNTKENTNIEKGAFEIQPVEEAVADPTYDPNAMGDFLKELSKMAGGKIQMPQQLQGAKPDRIHPEFVVKSGDKETSLGGEGRVLKEKRENDVDIRTERIYRWQMVRKKTNKG